MPLCTRHGARRPGLGCAFGRPGFVRSRSSRRRRLPRRQASGYRLAMRSLGLAAEIDVVSTTYTQRGGYEGAKELLARPGRPTAVFAGADIVAMGVLEAFTEAGLSVPGDISVAGYDNTTFAAFGPISLTSVDQAGTEIGSNAARLLLERIADRRKTSVQVKLSPSLVPRRTTAPPPE
ncbi:substrate-binding domain-containing protein [Streptomyces canus]|uniref:substrate-binding domain-containing protein n=1 Tax=Streptomyces canus TaxID=58343 RepID=UPI00324F1076